jgi:CheY-like chemotaxis protein
MNTRPCILVVDDDENDLRMIAGALPKGGDRPEVCFAHDGEEALDFVYERGAFKSRTSGMPGLVMLDLHMPRVNGWEVLRQMKSDPQLRWVPIVIFSSSARDSDVCDSYELGANAYVVKPIDFELFRQTVKSIDSFWINCNYRAPTIRNRARPLSSLRRPRASLKPETA